MSRLAVGVASLYDRRVWMYLDRRCKDVWGKKSMSSRA